jgi:hypothetical protein
MQVAVDVADRLNVSLSTPDWLRDDKLRRGCTLFIAHTGWQATDHVRGGSAFQAGVSTALQVVRDKRAGTVVVNTVKQRDTVEADPVRLQPLQVGDSMVLVGDNRVFSASKPTPGQVAKLRALYDNDGAMTLTAWALTAGVGKGNFKRVATALRDGGYVTSMGDGYVITNAGRGALGVPLAGELAS